LSPPEVALDTAVAAAPSGTQYMLAAGRHRAVVVEVGGGVRSYEHAGVPVLAGYPAEAVCPAAAGGVLAPWPNRVASGRYAHRGTTHQLVLSEPDRGNAIHGLVRWVRWTAEEVHPDSVTLVHDLPPRPGYPFALRLTTRWSVGPGGLRADHTVTNTGGADAPFGLGAHPYVDVGATPLARVRVEVPAARRLVVDDRMLPVEDELVHGTPYDLRRGPALGALRLDTAFTGLRRDADGVARVRVRGDAGRGAEVWMDAAFTWVQVFTAERSPAALSCPGAAGPAVGAVADAAAAPAVAVEPMSCAPDAFNSGAGLVVLRPGERWRGAWGVRPLVG
jgi:aldose 1-epimerase